MTRTLILAAIPLLFLPACDGDGDNPDAAQASPKEAASATVYACHAPSENDANCVEWRGGAFPDEAAAREECAANRGQFAGNACSPDNVVARCVRHKGTPMEQHEVWYGPKVTREAIEAGCKGPDIEFRPS